MPIFVDLSKLSDVVKNDVVKKTVYNTKISEIGNKFSDHEHEKYITTSEFNKLTAGNFIERLAQTNLVTKTDFNAKPTRLNKKINSDKKKHKLQAFESSYFCGKNYFEDDTQNYLTLEHYYYLRKYLTLSYLRKLFIWCSQNN